ncbi:MAG: helix-hairpin-helix domain-containing protein [Verrucomicrobiota bacterium]|nr:helix-hairpin-helix domain-containing protein [Verrucomicrobiota bacterium]
MFILQGLPPPGIGPGKAERLLAAFGSVEGVFGADTEELAEIEGIGRKTAQAIRDLIGPDAEDRPGSSPDFPVKADRA